MKELAIDLKEVELLVLQGRALIDAIKVVSQPTKQQSNDWLPQIPLVEHSDFQAKKEKILLWAWNNRYPAKEIE